MPANDELPKTPSLKKRAIALIGIAAGLADSGASALTTFFVGLYAVRILPSEGLALFSLFMTGYITCALLPQQLVFMPSRLRTNVSVIPVRPVIRHDMWWAKFVSVAAVLLVMSFGLPLLGHVETAQYLAMGITASGATVFGALQGHVRASMHVMGQHGAAALASLTTLIIVLTTLLTTESVGLNPQAEYAIPFGSLALGYALSILWWPLMVRRYAKIERQAPNRLRSRVLFVMPDILVQLTWYSLSLIVVATLGPVLLAELEAARVVAAPVFVLAAGISSYALPKVIRTVKQRRPRKGFRALRSMQVMIAAGAAIYSLLLLALAPLLSSVFQRPVNAQLAASRAAAFGIEGASNAINPLFIVQDRVIGGVLIIAGSCALAVIAAAPALLLLGPLGLPLCQALSSVARIAGSSVYLRSAANRPSGRHRA